MPFLYLSNDTFMDWTNTALWAHNPGAYSEWGTVYPPLSFVYLRLVSIGSCYRFDNLYARKCDWLFDPVFAATYFVNSILVYLCYWKKDRKTALFRGTAINLGLPTLFAIERGQLALPCFTFLVLAHGGILRSGWLRWIATAVTINFKPYLLLTVVSHLVRRRWVAFEGCLIATAIVYLLTYALEGAGTPLDLIRNILVFDDLGIANTFDAIYYQSSYRALIEALGSQVPYMRFVGSQPIEFLAWILPLIVKLGQLGIVSTLIGALVFPKAVPTSRLVLLSILLATSNAAAGGYTQMFVFFLLFLERTKGPVILAAIVCAYLLSISIDHQFFGLWRGVNESYLSGWEVGYTMGINYGELVRPGLVMIIEYVLVAASLTDLFKPLGRHLAARTNASSNDALVPAAS